MNVQQFVLGIVCLCVGALISYFITTLTQRKVITDLAKSINDMHEREFHKESVSSQIEKHKKGCPASNKFDALHTGIVFLVTKQGGNLKDLGLIS